MIKSEMIEEVFHRINSLREYKNWTIENMREWFEKKSPDLDVFLKFLNTLPQRNHILDTDAYAWFFSAWNCPDNEACDDEKKMPFFMGACSGLKKLSAYNAALIAAEFYDPENKGSFFKTAESVRRDMLLKNLYASIPVTPKSRLLKFAREAMEMEAFQALYFSEKNRADFLRIGVFDGSESETIAAYGRRYSFCYSLDKARSITWHPVLYLADKSEKEAALWEMASICASLEEDVCGNCALMLLDQESYIISSEIIQRPALEPYLEKVSKAVKRFREHLLSDTPIPAKPEPEKVTLDSVTETAYLSLSRKLGGLSRIRKASEAREKTIRDELMAVLEQFASANGVSVADLVIPKGSGASLSVRTALNQEKLSSILSTVPYAAERVFKSREADPELMRKALEDAGIDERLWTRGVCDKTALALLCQEQGLEAPFDRQPSIRISATRKKQGDEADNDTEAEGMMDEILDKMHP